MMNLFLFVSLALGDSQDTNIPKSRQSRNLDKPKIGLKSRQPKILKGVKFRRGQSFILCVSCQVGSNSFSIESDVDLSSNKTEEERPLLKQSPGLNPLAAGGIGLLSGLLLITATVGIFILATRRRSPFVYESAPPGDVVQHI